MNTVMWVDRVLARGNIHGLAKGNFLLGAEGNILLGQKKKQT